MGSKKKTAKRPVKRKTPVPRAGKKAATKKSPTTKAAAVKMVRRRPKVTAEEKLYLLFKEDYEARQVFAYLRVETVGELEAHSPTAIIDILTRPLQATVERIRRRLAEKNRCLAGDDAFLARSIAEQDASREANS